MIDRTRNITEARIKSAFISEVLSRTAEKIRAEQAQAIEDWNLFDSGQLKRSIQGHFDVIVGNPGATLTMRNLAYLRMLDIPNKRRRIPAAKREGYHLYNRITYGNLYGYMLRELRYGMTNELREQIRDLLSKSIA